MCWCRRLCRECPLAEVGRSTKDVSWTVHVKRALELVTANARRLLVAHAHRGLRAKRDGIAPESIDHVSLRSNETTVSNCRRPARMNIGSASMKNTKLVGNIALLYSKSILSAGLLLYSSRVVLSSLGVDDFGIYSLLGGTIALCAFVNTSIAVSTQRFLSYEMGQGDQKSVSEVLDTSILIHCGIACIVAIIAETGGFHLLAHLQIPPERQTAAVWSYHALVANLAISIMLGPFQALLNAHEDMHIVAGCEIADSLLRTVAAVAITHIHHDRLITYSVAVAVVPFVSLVSIVWICRARYKMSPRPRMHDRQKLVGMLRFSWWNLFGALAMIGKNQGLAIVLNLFHGVIINTAYAIANQVAGQLLTLSQSVTRAATPQIAKGYSVGAEREAVALTCRATRVTFWIMLTMAVPILFDIEFVLQSWLGRVPEYAPILCRLVVITALVESLSSPLMALVQATGNIKYYTLCIGAALLSILPLSCWLLRLSVPPAWVLAAAMAMSAVAHIVRMEFAERLAGLSKRMWLSSILPTTLPVVFAAVSVALAVTCMLPSGPGRFGLLCLTAPAAALSSVCRFGLDASEKRAVRAVLLQGLSRWRSALGRC